MGRFKDLELKIAAGVAAEADFAGFEPKDVYRIKEAVPMQHRGLLCPAEIESALALVADGPAAKATSPTMTPEAAARMARTKTLIFNVQLGDRMGDVLLSSPADAKRAGGTGWELQHWIAAGAPYLWCHDPYDGGVVGKCSNTRPEKVRATLQNGEVVKAWALVSDVEFLADDRLEHAVESWAMIEAGFKASSVGFIPKVTKYIEDEEERAAWGLGRWGVLICTSELLECSHVLIPANPWSIEVDRANGKAIVDVARKMVGKGLMTASRADRLQQSIERKARAAVLLPDLSKILAPKLAAAKTISGKPCEGLECMAASGGETAVEDDGFGDGAGTVARWNREERERITGRGGVEPGGVLLLGSGDQRETLIPLSVGQRLAAGRALPAEEEAEILRELLAEGRGGDAGAVRREVQHRRMVEAAEGLRAALKVGGIALVANQILRDFPGLGDAIRQGPAPATDHDCGCGAKTLQQQLADAKAAHATAESRIRELEALPEIRNVLAVRRAMDAASESVEHLATALDGDENVEDALEPPEVRSTFLLDLQAVQADTTLLGVLEPLMRVLAAKTRSGAPRIAAAPAVPSPRVVGNAALAADLSAAVADCQSARASLGARATT